MMDNSQLLDYTNQAFMVPIIKGGVKGYASIHAELYYHQDEPGEDLPSDGLDFTGSYYVYLLHPGFGSTNFMMEPDNSYSGWQRIGGPKWVDEETTQKIINAIEEWRKNPTKLFQ